MFQIFFFLKNWIAPDFSTTQQQVNCQTQFQSHCVALISDINKSFSILTCSSTYSPLCNSTCAAFLSPSFFSPLIAFFPALFPPPPGSHQYGRTHCHQWTCLTHDWCKVKWRGEMMLCSPGDNLDDNDHNDKRRFSSLIAFDFPTGQQERRWELGLPIQRVWPLISQQGPADASQPLSLSLSLSPYQPSLDGRAGSASRTLLDWKFTRSTAIAGWYEFKTPSMSFLWDNIASDIFQYMRTCQCGVWNIYIWNNSEINIWIYIYI